MPEINPEREKPIESTEADKASLEELKKCCDELSRHIRHLEDEERSLTLRRGAIESGTREAEDLDEQIILCQQERLAAKKRHYEAQECWSDKFAVLYPDDEHSRRWIEVKTKRGDLNF